MDPSLARPRVPRCPGRNPESGSSEGGGAAEKGRTRSRRRAHPGLFGLPLGDAQTTTATGESMGRIACLTFVFVAVSCAGPLESGAESRVLESRDSALDVAPNPDCPNACCSFEGQYRGACEEQGTTGVTADSMTSIVESMAALCGASADAPEQPDEQHAEEDSEGIEF